MEKASAGDEGEAFEGGGDLLNLVDEGVVVVNEAGLIEQLRDEAGCRDQ